MARFSIFGASGFIGSHLTASLRQVGHDVIAIGRNDFPPSGQSLGHVVYCIGLTANFRNQLETTVRAHVCVLADVLASYKYDSFLYLSSTRVYANATETREEAALLVRPELADHVYNLSKLTGEALCLARPEPTARVARISNVIGAGDAAINFLPSVVDEARRKGEVVMHTSKQSSKDYIDIDDVCGLLERIVLRGKSRLYNVASGVNVSNESIGALIVHSLAAKVKFAVEAPRVVFPPIDTSRICSEFKFSATPFDMSFERLVRATVRKEDHR
jgi:nucleoside-diphosphate-sugar epimerase